MFRGGSAGPWFLREIAKPTPWLDQRTHAADLIQIFTTVDNQPVSVYTVDSDNDEAEVAAALTVGRDISLSTPRSLLRIPRSCLPSSMRVDELERGITGVAAVDGKHCNLIGDRDSWLRLVESLLDDARLGADLHRTIGTRALGYQWQRIYAEVDERDSKRDRIRRYLELIGLPVANGQST